MPFPVFYNQGSSAGFTGTSTLQWIPQTGGLPTPAPPLVSQAESVAYWTYDYQWFVGILNTALVQAFNSAVAQALAAPTPVVFASSAPIVTYDGTTKMFTFWGDELCTPSISYPNGSSDAGSELMTVRFNQMLSDLLLFPATFDSLGNAQLNFDQGLSKVPPFSRGGTDTKWVALVNDFSPVASLWSPIGSLVIQTSLMPTDSELVSRPTVYGALTAGNTVIQTTGDSAKVLTDVVPNIMDASDWRSQTTLYTPMILRYIDMPTGDHYVMDQVDFKLGWRNAGTGTITDITLNPMASCEVKIMLRRKDILD